MARIYQNRDPELSLLQSAIDEVSITNVAGGVQSIGDAIATNDRPGLEDPMVYKTASLGPDIAHMRASGQDYLSPGPALTGPVTERVGDVLKYCAALAFNYAKAKLKGDHTYAEQCMTDLRAPFGSCDLRYAEAAEQAVTYFDLAGKEIPYVPWKNIGDFVIDDPAVLPSNARIAVIGDWGTGQDEALAVLKSLAAKRPHVVIHLGDVYYAGTEPEQQHYFFDNWAEILQLSPNSDTRVVTAGPRTFSLAGNHDMYSGGVPYYKMIQQLQQPASFFCLRNKDWQFIGLDTGYYDHGFVEPCTRLAPGQPEWLADKVNNGGRNTVLLSHHQLFSNQEKFDPKQPGVVPAYINPLLLADVEAVLPKVALWLWGHQHQFVAYADPLVKARCQGHGAYPVGITEVGQPANVIPVDTKIPGQQHGQDFWDNGYTLVELNGPTATVTYYSVDDTGTERTKPPSERIGVLAAS